MSFQGIASILKIYVCLRVIKKSEVWIVIVGLLLQGYGCAFSLPPSMPEMIAAASTYFPESKDDLSDRISGIISFYLLILILSI